MLNAATQAVVKAQKTKKRNDKRMDGDSNYPLTQVVKWLMPWAKKTRNAEVVGDWETTLPTTMIVNLLKMWLTPESQQEVEKLLHFYHPLDRAAMAYALVVYLMTGHIMKLRSAVAKQHFKHLRETLKADMPELAFSGHIKYMMRTYGKKSKQVCQQL